MQLRRVSIALLAAGALALTGCSLSPTSEETTAPSGATTAGDLTYPATIDTKFGEVTVEEKPERVVALGWGDAEVALALGTQPVGAADWIGFGGDGVGPWAEGLYDKSPEILGTMELSYEAVAALKPDLIIDVRSSGDKERYDRLSSIATTVGVPEGGDSWLATPEQQVTMISTALGQPEKGQELLQEVDDAFAKVAEEHSDWADKTVTVATRTSETWGAYVNDPRVTFFKNLGFTPSSEISKLPLDENGWSVSLSPEQLDLLDADLLVAFPIFIDTKEITDDAGWKLIPAVADGHSIVIDGDLSNAFSLATPAATLYAIDQFTPLIEKAVK